MIKIIALHFVNLVSKDRNLNIPEEHNRLGIVASVASIALNLLLAFVKLTMGIIVNSISLVADAAHSVSDLFSSLVVFIAFHLANKKPDRNHPHGHGRIEYLSGLAVAVMLILTALFFAYKSYARLLNPVYPEPGVVTFSLLALIIIVKEILYHFSLQLGNMISSEAITGDAWHHRSDSLTSLLVLIALIGAYFGFYTLDVILGFLIALYIAYTGSVLAVRSLHKILGAPPTDELKENLAACAREIDGVVDAHDIVVHDYGSRKAVTMHVTVISTLTLEKAHIIAHKVEEHVTKKYYCHTLVHLDPE